MNGLLDEWMDMWMGEMGGQMDEGKGIMEYTKRRNLDRGYMKLEAWHYEVENKLLRLIESLESKRRDNNWQDTLPSHPSINPFIHPSNNPNQPRPAP
jgi:hypothetical protein